VLRACTLASFLALHLAKAQSLALTIMICDGLAENSPLFALEKILHYLCLTPNQNKFIPPAL